MIATAAIELSLAAYTLYRYSISPHGTKRSSQGRFANVAAAMLFLLAIFQISEYQICREEHGLFWSRFGLVAITLLPIVGLYLVSLISRKQHFLRLGYAIAAASVFVVILAPKSIISSFCGGNYVIFSGPEELFRFYSAYYFGFLVLGIWESVEALNANSSKRKRRLLEWMIVGYLSFMLPTGIVYAAYAPARLAVASIMCGFAVILAVILTFEIVPKYYRHSA